MAVLTCRADLVGGPPDPQPPTLATELLNQTLISRQSLITQSLNKIEMGNTFLCIQKLFLSSPPLGIG